MKQYHEIMIYTREENQKEKEMNSEYGIGYCASSENSGSKFKDVCRNSWAEKPFRGEKETVFYDDGAQTEKINF